MAKYYEDVRLSNEVYSWSTVFDCEHRSISRVDRNLECQHYLVQERHDVRAHILGLTSIGFERWVTLLIQVYPEEEFSRDFGRPCWIYQSATQIDGKERFSKEISRQLFPDHEEHKVRNCIEDSMAERVAVGNHRRESQEEISPQPPPPSDKANVIKSPRASQNRRRSVRFADQLITSTPSLTYIPSYLECERHSPSAFEFVINDTLSPPSSPLSYSVAWERKHDSAPPRGAERFQDGFRRIKPRSESFADLALRLGRTRFTSAAHPKSLNINTRRRGEGPQPETLFDYDSASGASRRHGGPSSCRPSTDHFRRSDSDARGYEQTL